MHICLAHLLNNPNVLKIILKSAIENKYLMR